MSIKDQDTVKQEELNVMSANIDLIRNQYSSINNMIGSVITISTDTQKEIRYVRDDLNDFKRDIKKDLRTIAENISLQSRSDHENNCPARKDMPSIMASTSENTGIIKTMARRAYRSIPPTRNGNKKIAKWIKVTSGVTALITAIATFLAVIL